VESDCTPHCRAREVRLKPVAALRRVLSAGREVAEKR